MNKEFTPNKKVEKAWTFYDWANSVFALTITTAVFPIYYESVTASEFNHNRVWFLGMQFQNTALYSYALSLSFLLVALISPILSGIADYSGSKKSFMKFFVYFGSIGCFALAMFDGPETIGWAIIPLIVGSIGFNGSIVFYNAYLPEITTPDRYDKLSAQGFAMGYIGSVILLIVNLAMIMKPDLFGLEEGKITSQISFITVGLWWIGFSQYSFKHLPTNVYNRKPKGNRFTKGFKELKSVWNALGPQKSLKRFLLSFFLYSMGLQTVMYIATLFGSKELGLDAGELIPTVLVIQLVAVGGAYLFAYMAKRLGNIKALIYAVIIWIGVCVGAYFVTDFYGFVVLAAVVGLVMGGIQSLSRSSYSKLLPETQDHASYFSFYDFTEKIGIVLGTFAWGLIEELTGSMRGGIIALVIFFILGLVALMFVKDSRLKAAE